ncbi:hypothetical protein AURDEDRAFT_177933 [Auricularia subglabra TFB-10046 SS5]|uniref:JmjC domain-containing protein n=1 Tax=Auricularia subglabra (strain TFB-10046 / SS5) TaxID=717982 RepID=J0L9E8_AURST|nr:hypothetical protein AURDEDRAFT_177933 [Auricularia subglabra TFB-10046 SS5]
MQHVQCDLDALNDLGDIVIIADQRDLPSIPLTNGSAVRAALNACLPVAFDLPHNSELGMRAAPDARVPNYAVHAVDSTIVAGSGTLLPPCRSTANLPIIFHIALGQVLLLHLPLTPANELGPPEGCSLLQQFLWAARQPSAVLRVLFPGDSAFIPAMHWRCMIALGSNGSSFAAVVLLHVRRIDESRAYEGEGDW